MSYDLMVFDPAAVPAGHAEFMKWYEDQTKWDEPHGYDDPTVCTPGLRALVLDLVVRFPALNGPLSPRELPEDESAPADYSIGRQVVYGAFAWSRAQEAFALVKELAGKHRNQLTVEWRNYSSPSFKHFVGGKGVSVKRVLFSRGTTAIQTSATRVLVRHDQVLTQEDALKVFLAFLHGQPLTELLQWTDVTSKFA